MTFRPGGFVKSSGVGRGGPGIPRPVKESMLATEHPTTLDIAWAAGIFEGEGHADNSAYKSGGLSTRVKIAQKERWILDRLRARFGGSVFETTSYKHSYPQWQVAGVLARGFLFTIFTFLSPHKRLQVKRALGIAE